MLVRIARLLARAFKHSRCSHCFAARGLVNSHNRTKLKQWPRSKRKQMSAFAFTFLGGLFSSISGEELERDKVYKSDSPFAQVE